MILVPILTLLLATVAMRAPEDAAFQIGVADTVAGTVQRYPSGANLQGYLFTIAPRANGELPLWQTSHHQSGGAWNLYRKTANGQYAIVATNFHRDNESDIGVLLPAGDYVLGVTGWQKRLLISGIWAGTATQQKYWSMLYSQPVVQVIDLQGGGTLTAKTFDITARPDGALPYAVFNVDLYRKNGAGKYEIYCKSTADPILVQPGSYAYPGSSADPANAFYTSFWGIWVAP